MIRTLNVVLVITRIVALVGVYALKYSVEETASEKASIERPEPAIMHDGSGHLGPRNLLRTPIRTPHRTRCGCSFGARMEQADAASVREDVRRQLITGPHDTARPGPDAWNHLSGATPVSVA